MAIERRIASLADVLELSAQRKAGGGPQSIEDLVSRRHDWATMQRRLLRERARAGQPRPNGGTRLPMPIQRPGQSAVEHAMAMATWRLYGQ